MSNTIVLPTPAGKPRYTGHKVDMIVIHAMSEYLHYGEKHVHARDFLNINGLSCHYMINGAGSLIACADPFKQTTWHAKGHNTHSIGIELLIDGLHSYHDFLVKMRHDYWLKSAQEIRAINFCAALMMDHNMEGSAAEHIKLHCDLDPERKIDPGKVKDWRTFFGAVDEELEILRNS